MSRDINGNYTLPPVVNPVTSGTNITVTWANSTLADVAAALTDSLSRSGSGGMSAPLRIVDGTAGAPGVTFGSETTTGFYRISAGTVGLTLSGTAQYRFTPTGMDFWDGAAWISVTDIAESITTFGQSLITSANALTGRGVLGATAIGESLFTATATSTRLNINKNRFCNGVFMFDQRGLGTAFTINSAAETRTLDCLTGTGRVAGGVFTVQQIATGGPVGSPTFVRCTVTTADAAIPAANAYWVRALLEGFNTSDLGWGAAGALPISIGFWFRASITGTFSGSVQNAAANRSYPVSWSYPTANVWQFVPLQNIPGDVTGTWPITNVRSMQINFCLGAGTSAVGPANAWAAAGHLGATGTTNLMATSGATFDLALLQPEAGAVCTPFEWIPYQAGLQRVQRYLPTIEYLGDAKPGQAYSASFAYTSIQFPVTARVRPTGLSATGTYTLTSASGAGLPVTGFNFSSASVNAGLIELAVASGLVAGDATLLLSAGAARFFFTGAEL